MIATGARARTLPGIEPDGERIWTYREAMVPPALPRSLLVIGSGAIGIEFASFYRDLGAEVAVVEILPRILPAEDEDDLRASRSAPSSGAASTIHTGARSSRSSRSGDGVLARVARRGRRRCRASRPSARSWRSASRATSRTSASSRPACASSAARSVVDEWCRTDEPGVYAIGDVAGPPLLAHKAMHEGVLCVERIAGYADARPLDRSRIPGCTYSRPQIASVGLQRARGARGGHTVRVGRFPFQGNGKAIAIGEKEGLVKTVFDATTGELLGAHMVGAEVTEMIQGFATGALARGDGGGADPRDVPAPDALGDDARGRARRLRARAARVGRGRAAQRARRAISVSCPRARLRSRSAPPRLLMLMVALRPSLCAVVPLGASVT